MKLHALVAENLGKLPVVDEALLCKEAAELLPASGRSSMPTSIIYTYALCPFI